MSAGSNAVPDGTVTNSENRMVGRSDPPVGGFALGIEQRGDVGGKAQPNASALRSSNA